MRLGIPILTIAGPQRHRHGAAVCIRSWTVLLMFFGCSVGTVTAVAQDRPVSVTASALYDLPIGSLHSRFLGAPGWMVSAGREVDASLEWFGVVRHTGFTLLNTKALTKTATIGQGLSAKTVSLPLPLLTMDLNTTSVTAEAHLGLFRMGEVNANGIIGFGFTNWIYSRGAYNDSLFANDPSTGSPVKVAALAVPALRQEDWSGTVDLGIEITGPLVGPVDFTCGAGYKLIVGELWQTLDLDMENVAGMQFLSLRAGLKATW